jgi:hypothetical protein
MTTQAPAHPAEAPAASEARPLLLRALWATVGGFLASRLLLLVIGLFSRAFAELDASPVTLWVQWDSGWYLDILANGYRDTQILDGPMLGQANYAFFPAYPLLAHLLAQVMPPVWACLVLSNVCLVAASVLLYVHAASRFDERTARMAVVSLFFFPGSFVFSAVMTEALFVLVTLGAFHFALRRAPGRSAAFGFVACATRATGVLLVLGMLLAWLRERVARRWEDTDWSEPLKLSLAPLGLVAYMAFLHWKVGDAFAFQGVQTFWYRHFENPLSVLFKELVGGAPHLRLQAGLALVTLAGLVVAGRRVLTLGEWVFVALALLPALATSMDSMPRYVLGLFPVHLVVGTLMARRESLALSLPACMGLLNGFLMSHWSRGHNAFF